MSDSKEFKLEKIKQISYWIEDDFKRIIDNLNKESIDVYNFLKDEFTKSDVNDNYLFQFVFRSFYRIDNAGLTPEFKKEYFKILEEYRGGIELDFEKVLRRLYEFPNRKGNENTFQFSFVTKMFNTIDDSMPIYDSEVAKMFSFTRPYQKEFDIKLKKYSEQFKEIKEGYEQIDKLNLIPKTIECFDQTFKNNKLSKMKKLDFIFWSAGKVKTKKQ